jgi:hypothetical protein
MRNAVTVSAVLYLLTFTPLLRCQDPPPDALFSPDQLDNLLAPVALYADPLLAQVLVAATFPDQVDEAARFVRADSNLDDIDGQSWDVSVKAVAHYPTVLFTMADQLDWTTSLGQAYVNQSDDVMAAVQRLRAEAEAAGNLQSDADMQVVNDGGDIEIWPEQPQYIYVPDYDPTVIYVQRTGISYGPGFAIGAWLNVDFNWRAHTIFYHGWDRDGWVRRSRPYVRTLATYVNPRLQNVTVNRTVVNRNVNYSNLTRFESVHHDAGFQNLHAGNNGRSNPVNNNQPVNNKIIERNLNSNDSRINDYRGHVMAEPQQGQTEPPPQPSPEVNRQQPSRQAVQPPEQRPNEQRSEQRPNEQRPVQQRQVERPLERPAPSAFGGNQGGFNARESSQRGQESRQEQQRPAPQPRPAPAPRQEQPRAEPQRSAPAPAAHEEGGKKR